MTEKDDDQNEEDDIAPRAVGIKRPERSGEVERHVLPGLWLGKEAGPASTFVRRRPCFGGA